MLGEWKITTVHGFFNCVMIFWSKQVVINPLKPDVWERLVLPGGGAQRHPLEINEGVSGEQDSLNTIFNTHKIRIVCKIWSSYFIVHARARSF